MITNQQDAPTCPNCGHVAVRNGAWLPAGPPHPVRLLFRGELLAVYGPVEDGPGLRPLVML